MVRTQDIFVNPTPHCNNALRAMRTLAAAFGLCIVHAIVLAQPAPAIPAKAGEAAGTIVAGKTTVALKYAYAQGPVDGAYNVLLTDGPIPAEEVAAQLKFGGGQRLLRQGKLSGVYLLVGKEGFVQTLIPFVGEDLRGGSSMASVGKLDSFAATPAGISGQGTQKLAQTMGQGWSYAASFNAAPIKP